MPPLHIVVDGRSYEARSTGVGFYLRHLMEAFIKGAHGQRFTFFHLPGQDRVFRELPGAEACEFVETRSRLSDHPRGDWWRHVTLPAELRSRRADLLFAPAYFTPWRCPCPIVTAVHDLIVFSDGQTFPPLFAFLLRRAIEASARRSAHLLVASRATVDEWAKRLPASLHKVRLIPDAHGSNFRPWQAEEGQRQAFLDRLGLPRRPFVLAVSTLEPRKNLQVLVDALARLHEGSDEAPHLVLAGATGWKATPLLDRIDALGQAGWLHRTGYLPDEDLVRLYAMAAVFVYPSLREGFGIPILEAMACGTPVVTSRRSSMIEVAGDAALLLDEPEDPIALAEILEGLLADEGERTRLRQAGLEQASRFSWERAAEETLKVFEEAVSKN